MSNSAIVSEPRTIILCFDGTGNKFGEENSNVVRFFRALQKDKPEKQIVYYQPGIGTYNKRQFFTQTVSAIASTLDQAVALHLNDHAKEGYQFVMQNYRKGDKICLFGFSRGAHTARVVAGMLYKIGIIPPFNDQQLDFAFSVYQTTGPEGYDLSKEFKRTFAMPVTVEFVGVWDTVSSVGIIPRYHPYTSVNYAVKTFRHALALDERRARFRPNLWTEPTLEREQDLDVDEPPNKSPPDDPSDDTWVYEPPNRNLADVEEVWFAGAHADVGGGSHPNKIKDSLAYIPLRWMIKECFATRTGILFDLNYLRDQLDFNLEDLVRELKTSGLSGEDIQKLGIDEKKDLDEESDSTLLDGLRSPTSKAGPDHPRHLGALVASRIAQTKLAIAVRHVKDHSDSLAAIWDQLFLAKSWWGLEIIPMLTTYQLPNGNWIRRRMRNFGQGRYIPFHDDIIKVHKSVEDRIERTKDLPPNQRYTPSAYNWEAVTKSGMLEYVA